MSDHRPTLQVDQEEQIHDDLENEVPEVDDILGDGMASPEAAGFFLLSDDQ